MISFDVDVNNRYWFSILIKNYSWSFAQITVTKLQGIGRRLQKIQLPTRLRVWVIHTLTQTCSMKYDVLSLNYDQPVYIRTQVYKVIQHGLHPYIIQYIEAIVPIAIRMRKVISYFMISIYILRWMRDSLNPFFQINWKNEIFTDCILSNIDSCTIQNQYDS